MSTIRVAVVQASSVLMNREESLNKALKLIDEAAKKGAKFVLFPEAFLSGYPRGLNFCASVGIRGREGRKDWRRYWESAIELPSKESDILGKAAKKYGIYLAMGMIERETEGDKGTVYCTIAYYGPDGRYLGKHRKLKPTAGERAIWGEGDGSTLTAIETPFGKIGGLICWENYVPLARAAMYQKGLNIYIAPTADARDGWIASMQHIALESRCFVMSANQYVTKEDYPEDLASYDELADKPEVICRGASMIVNPLGEVLAGPEINGEAILTADLDMDLIPEARFDFDVTGHYALSNVFKLIVNTEKKQNVIYVDKSKEIF